MGLRVTSSDASIEDGDWDGLRRTISGAVEPVQLLGMRDVLLGPLEQVSIPRERTAYAMYLGGYEYQLGQMARRFRHYAGAMLNFPATETIWARPDVPQSRHF